jgi:hypothetical protein
VVVLTTDRDVHENHVVANLVEEHLVGEKIFVVVDGVEDGYGVEDVDDLVDPYRTTEYVVLVVV